MAKDNSNILQATTTKGVTSQTVFIADLISEGPIEGLVYGEASVFLNDTRLKNIEDASYKSTDYNGTISFSGSTGTVTGMTTGPVLNNPGEKWIRLLNVASISGVTITKESSSIGIIVFDLTKGAETFNSLNSITDMTKRCRIIKDNGDLVEGTEILGNVAGGKFYVSTAAVNDIEFSGANYTIVQDRYYPIASISYGANATIGVTGTPPAGSYSFVISSEDTGKNAVFSSGKTPDKYEETTVQFRVGEIYQKPMDEIGGVGNVSIAGNATNLELKQVTGSGYPEDHYPDGESADGVVQSIVSSSAGFNLTSAQVREVDEIRFTISYGSLIRIGNKKGNESSQTVLYKVELDVVYNGNTTTYDVYGGDAPPLVHTGKTNSPISFGHSIPIEAVGPRDSFTLKITRLTRHSGLGVNTDGSNANTSGNQPLQNSIGIVSGVSSIIKEKFNYPLTAYAGITFSSREFTSVPQRTYEVRGLKVKVPSNYTTREKAANGIADYSGVWNGSFKTEKEYTDNPAWIFYDILSNDRYGVGKWLNENEIDKYALYRIARYCDELVDDGKGGLEPRFRANLYLTKATDVYKVIKDMATIFMGMLYWMDGQISPVIDQPNDPVFNFNKSNVVGGTFNYETTGSKTRVNQVIVSWNNPEANYELQPLIVEDRDAIVETGRIISQDAVAFGATSEGQATRFGRWKLWTAQNQKELVSFQSALNVGFLKPGDVINVQDSDRYPNSSLSGRIVSQTSGATPLSTTLIPLDRNVTLSAGYTYTLSVLITESSAVLTQEEATISSTTYYKGDVVATNISKEDASNILDDSSNLVAVAFNEHSRVETRAVSNSSGTHASLTPTSAFSALPAEQSPWVLVETEVTSSRNTAGSAKQYRILSITESARNTFDIAAIEYYEQKYDAVDKDYLLGSIEDPVFPPKDNSKVPPPKNVYVLTNSDFKKPGEEITLRWDPPDDYRFTAGYEILHGIEGLDSPIAVSKDVRSYSFTTVPDGLLTFGVRTITTDKDRSRYATSTIRIDDPFSADVPRLAYGVPQGVFATSDIFIDDTDTLIVEDKVYAMAPIQDASAVYTSAFGTSSSWSIDVSNITKQTYEGGALTPLVDFLQSYYVLFDYSAAIASNIPFKVMKWDFLSLKDLYFWWDINASPRFTNLTGTVSVDANSNLVTGSGTSFTTELAVGDIIKLSTENQTYFGSPLGDYGARGAKVSAIVSDTQIYIDRSFSTAISGYQAKVPSTQIDFETDAFVAKVWEPYNGGVAAPVKVTSFITIKPSLRKTFRQDDPPDAVNDNLQIGDLWYDTNDNNRLYIWVDSNADGIGDTWQDTAQTFTEAKMQGFFCPNEPTAGVYPNANTVVNAGDYWWKSNAASEAVSWYTYVNSAWTQVEFNALGRALAGGYWYDNATLSPPQTFAIFWWTAEPTDSDRPDGQPLQDYDIWYQNANADTSAWYWNNTSNQWVYFEAKGKLATKDTVSSPDIDADIVLKDTLVLNNTSSPEKADLKFEAGAAFGGGTAHYISSEITGDDLVGSIEDGNIQNLLITMYDENLTHLDKKGASIADSDVTIVGGAITAIAATTPNTSPYDKPDQVVVTIIDPVGSGAEFTANIDGSGYITSYTQVSGGSGYSSTPGEEPIIIVGQKIPTSRSLVWTNSWADDSSKFYFPRSTSVRFDGELFMGVNNDPMFATDAYLNEKYHIVGDSLTSTDGTEQYFGTNPFIIPHNSGTGVKSWAYQLKNDGYIDSTSTIDAAAGRTFSDYMAGPTIGKVVGVRIDNGGTGYSDTFAVTFTGGGGSGAAGTAYASGGVIQRVEITNWGTSNYTSTPTAVFTAGGGSGAASTVFRNSGIGESDFSTISSRKILVALGTNDAGNRFIAPSYFETLVGNFIDDVVTTGGKELAIILPYHTESGTTAVVDSYKNAVLSAAATKSLDQVWDIGIGGHIRGEWELGSGLHIGLEGQNMLRREIYNRLVTWRAAYPSDLTTPGAVTWAKNKYGLGAFGSSGYIYNTTGTELIVGWTDNAETSLYYDNVAKLDTTAAGVDINGSIAVDGNIGSTTYTQTGELLRIGNFGVIEASGYTVNDLGFVEGDVILAATGTAAAPGYAFTGNTDAGMYFTAGTYDAVSFSTQGAQRVQINSLALLSTVPILVPDGTAAAPAIAFSTDATNGLYLTPGTFDAISISTQGAQRVQVNSLAVQSTVPYLAIDGAVGAPSYTFTSDADTGIWSSGIGLLNISAAGSEVVEISSGGVAVTGNLGATSLTQTGELLEIGAFGVLQTSGITSTSVLTSSSNIQDLNNVTITTPSTNQVLTYNGSVWVNQAGAAGGYTEGDTIAAAVGTVTTPGYTFTGQTNTGLYLSTAGANDAISIATDGVQRLEISYLGHTSTVNYLAPDGLTGAPAYTFTSDADTGMWSSGIGLINFSTAGVERLEIDSAEATFTVPINSTGAITGSVLGAGNLTVDNRILVAASGGVGLSSTLLSDVLTTSSNIQDLNNVTITTPSTNQVLTYNGSIWINQDASASGYTDGDTIKAASGTAATPGLTFNADAGNGFYLVTGANDALHVATDGVNRATFSNTGLLVNALASTGNITCADPTTADHVGDRGYNDLRYAQLTGASFTGQILADYGTAGAPGISFDGDANLGIWRSAVDTLNISTAGVERVEIDATEATFTIPIASSGAITGSVLGAANLTVDNRILIAASGGVGLSSTLLSDVLTTSSNIQDLSNVTITTPSTNQVLTYNGSIWVNQDASASGYTDGDTIKAASGTAAAPGLTFNADAGNGFYLVTGANDALHVATDGVNRATFSNTGLLVNALVSTGNITCADPTTDDHVGDRGYNDARYAELTGGADAAFTGPIRADYGTVSLPGYAFDGDTNTGIWHSAADTLNISTAGVERVEIDATEATFTVPINSTGAITGSVLGAGNLTVNDRILVTASGGVGQSSTLLSSVLTTSSNIQDLSNVTITTPSTNQVLTYNGSVWVNQAASSGGYNDGDIIKAASGTAAAPGLTFNADAGNGFYLATGTNDSLHVATDGVNRATFSNLGLAVTAISVTGQIVGKSGGTTSSPSYTFSGDSDTGFFSDTANEIQVTCGNAQVAEFRSDGIFETTNNVQVAADDKRVSVGANKEFYMDYTSANVARLYTTIGSGNIVMGPSGTTILTLATTYANFTQSVSVTGIVSATSNIYAYYSDERLKDFEGRIPNAVEKIKAINGYYFKENKEARKLGYSNDRLQIGVNAQEVQKVLPEVIHDAPINEKENTDYMTVDYSRLTAVLIEAIKEQQAQIDELKEKINVITR